MSTSRVIKKILPPILIDLIHLSRTNVKQQANQIQWLGNYSSWADASSNSLGYDNEIILETVKNSLLKVKNGEAVYERDSVVFDKIEHPWPLLACLQSIAIGNNNKLHLIDFGGSLGSTYYQTIPFLNNSLLLKWFIVEQSHFVTEGKKYFEDEMLRFNYSIDEVLLEEKINCLLLSGVLQCLDSPFEWINKFLEKDFEYIIIDRTAFINDDQRLTVEYVPESIYAASYPSWFFNENQFLDYFAKKYELIADFKSYIEEDIFSEDQKRMYWKGFYMKKRTK